MIDRYGSRLVRHAPLARGSAISSAIGSQQACNLFREIFIAHDTVNKGNLIVGIYVPVCQIAVRQSLQILIDVVFGRL